MMNRWNAEENDEHHDDLRRTMKTDGDGDIRDDDDEPCQVDCKPNECRRRTTNFDDLSRKMTIDDDGEIGNDYDDDELMECRIMTNFDDLSRKNG